MTVTEASPDVATPVAPSPSAPPSGVAALVGSGDPRTVGKLFVGTSLMLLLVTGTVGLLVGFEQVDTSGFDIFGDQSVLQAWSLHAVAGLFLVLLPLVIGLATAVVPLQVGAATVAFPRASAAAYWTYLVASGLVLGAVALDGGPFGQDPEAVQLFVAGFVALLLALCVATVSVVTTVVTLRAPGMSLRRTPLFSWSMLVAGTVWLLVLPALAGVVLLAYVDMRYGGEPFLGGADGLHDRIAWVFWQPTLYAFAVPALGIVADVVPTFAQRRHHRHSVAMVLMGLLAALGFGAWAQLGATVDGGSPAPWLFKAPWVVVGVLAVLPVLGLLGLWTVTLARGRPRPAGALVLAMVAGALLLVGVAAGVGTVIEGLRLDNTTWMTAQTYAVLLGALAAAFAGLTFWAPKLYGKLLPDPLAGLAGVLLLVGGLVLAVPQALAGVLDQLRLVAGGADGVAPADIDTVELLNLVAAIGGVVVMVAFLAFLAALARPRTGDPGDDPWAGHTLEWSTTSPPPVGNFAQLPEITSEAPLYDARHARTLEMTEAAP